MMRSNLHPLFSPLIAHSLVWSANALVLAAMALAETGRHIVICSAGGAIDVLVGADGKLMKCNTGHHSCLECPACISSQTSFNATLAPTFHPDRTAEVLRHILILVRDRPALRSLASAHTPPIKA